MFSKFVLRTSAFLVSMFGVISAEVGVGCFEDFNNEGALYSVDPERLFMESGRLYFDSESGESVPLSSIIYSNDKCYASFLTVPAMELGVGDGISQTASLSGIQDIDIDNYGSRVSKPVMWQCPYCNRRWLLGERCKYEKCPTNQWKENEKP